MDLYSRRNLIPVSKLSPQYMQLSLNVCLRQPFMLTSRKTRSFFIPYVIALAALLLYLAVPSRAEESGVDEQNWSYVLYNNNNGMPFSEANALQQTEDGFIYVGCYGGLLRFDGEKFYRYEDNRLNNVVCLYADSRDRLFIGTNSNGFGILEKGSFTFYGKEEGLNSKYVRAFLEDDKGNVLIGTSEGLYYLTPENEVHMLSDANLEKSIIVNLYSDGRGRSYGLTKNSEVFILENLAVTSWFDRGVIVTNNITCIYPDPERSGFLYLGLDTGEVLRCNPTTHRNGILRLSTSELININCLLYRNGKLWITSDRGIGIVDEEGNFVRPDRMQRRESVQFIMSDREGNIWAASDRLGVIKISPSIFSNINSLANLPSIVVNTTFIKNNILYIGSDTGLICLDSEYNQVETPVSDLLKDERIRCIKEDSTGRVWFCTWSQGLICMAEDGGITAYSKEDGFFSNSVREIFEMSDGTIAISVKGGLYLWRDGKIVQGFEAEDGLPTPQILCMCEYAPGKLLIGSDGNGIHVVEDGQIKAFAQAESLCYDVILRINKKEDPESFWILTANALYVLHDEELTLVPDIPNLHNYDIFFDKEDNAWILAADGIYIGKASDMLAGKKIRYTHYDYKSGLPYIVTPHCRNYITDDGILYMAGNDGIVQILVDQAMEDDSTAQLTVTAIDVDDESVYFEPGEKVVLPSATKKIEIHAFALSYSLNEPVVSCKLEGFDDKESISNRSSLPSLIYTNLKGGSYNFRFAQIDPATGNIINEIDVPIVKEKAFYERAVFWILVAGAIAGIIMLCLKLYLKKKSREMEAEKEQHRIRTELSLAGQIQASVLPTKFPAFPERTEFDLYASMDPAKEVGGDFYDFFLIDEDHLALLIADVSGKGMGAALFMMAAKNVLKTTAMAGRDKSPGEILGIVNDKLCEDNKADMFVTVWLGILTISTGSLITANAGHEYPAFLREGAGYQLLKSKHGMPLGSMEGIAYKNTEWTLKKGEGLFVYTDGVPEANNAAEEFFGNERMLAALNQHAGESPKEVLKGLRSAVDSFVGDNPQFDDLTMLALTYNG